MIFEMKKLTYIFLLLIVAVGYSCVEKEIEAGFEDINKLTIYDYLLANEDNFSSFLSILEKGGLDKTLSAYNPDGNGYTLFAPDNDAIDRLINSSQQFSSLNDILNHTETAASFSRYHVVNMQVRSNEFPFGAFSEPTLSEDYLIVSFFVEPDTAYYKINNQATIKRTNIETSNGFVHHIETALEPVTLTSYQLLERNSSLSIFKEAVDLTGLQSSIDFNLKLTENQLAVTLLVEPDSVYQKAGINSVNELISVISPNNSDYTNTSNRLYNYVAYHILSGNFFIDDFVNRNTNYNTLSEIPLNVDGRGLDVAINRGKEVFDTLVFQGDTTIVDFIKILYDESNVVTQSGAIHYIDQVMEQQIPSRATTTYQFYEEPLINTYRPQGGSFLIENQYALSRINWSGADLFYVAGEDNSNASNSDYLTIDGDFIISYTIPRIVQGRYNVVLRAESFNAANAVVEVYIDRKKVGGMIDLSTGSSPTSPFRNIELGSIEFNSYEEHDIEIRALIPGRFLWDYIRFEPY
jgi:uncharacterized surface protein with fasciclin (FAS1) repeats